MRKTAALVVAAVLVTASGLGPAATAAEDTGFPFTFENCGAEVTVDQPPQRAIIFGSSPIPLVEGAGALDRAIAKAGEFPDGLYSEATRKAVAAIPTIGAGEDASGSVEISLEEILAQQPDLVIGYETETVTRAGLADAGVPMIVLPAFCSDPAQIPRDVGFEDVYRQVEFYGRVFGTQDTAAATVAELRERVAAVEKSFSQTTGRTAATLFVALGRSHLSAYGSRSMANAEMEAVGLTNVFSDTDERVFEVTFEELLARDPDVLVLLHVEGEAEDVRAELMGIPGWGDLTAVRNDDLLIELFGFTDPPTPLSVLGLEHLAQAFGTPA